MIPNIRLYFIATRFFALTLCKGKKEEHIQSADQQLHGANENLTIDNNLLTQH